MKPLLVSLMAFSCFVVQAQTNLQVHYDFGKNRQYVTTTLELFKTDPWGNTFFFVDYDFNYDKENHPALSYMEIARCLNTWGGPLSLQVEYNGGLGIYPAGNSTGGYTINNAYLIGLDYSIHNQDFSKTLNLKALYKRIAGLQNSAQITAVWGLHFMQRKLSITGFADCWLENNRTLGTHFIFLSEPQLWYNVTDHLSIGSETEFAVNFAWNKGLTINPTLATKWIF
jgi:hypothetical protein